MRLPIVVGLLALLFLGASTWFVMIEVRWRERMPFGMVLDAIDIRVDQMETNRGRRMKRCSVRGR
jgi:hypothetical protein